MPMRYLRKLLFCLGLMMPGVSTQGMVLLSANVMFLSFYGCYKPANSPVTNKVVLLIEVGLMLLICLFIGYDKMEVKSVSTQLGFSVALVVVEALLIVVVLVWAIYRLWLVIRETETWKAIYAKVTENKDPEYLK